nr:MAG TPA: hypothetical protein [Caudoviricetes sp.]
MSSRNFLAKFKNQRCISKRVILLEKNLHCLFY